MNPLPGQMELATVVDHTQKMGIISMITNDGAQNLEDVIDPQSPQFKWLMGAVGEPAYSSTRVVSGVIGGNMVELEVPCYDDYLVPPTKTYAQEDTHKPAGVRLAKMLSQYDDSPSSQLWSEIQGLSREILK